MKEETNGPTHVPSIVDQYIIAAIGLGAEAVDIEYSGGFEEVFASKQRVGYGIGRLRSSSSEAVILREELQHLARRKRRLTVGTEEYELRARVYQSFGEDAFRVDIRRV